MLKFEEIISKFQIEGEITDVKPLGHGTVNHTYEIVCGGEHYVLQEMNHIVFKYPTEVMNNLFLVTEYLHEVIEQEGRDPQLEGLTFIRTKAGNQLLQTENGSYFRLYRMICCGEEMEKPTTPEQAYEAANAVGVFHRRLRDFDSSQLGVTVPKLHDMKNAMRQLLDAVRADICFRTSDCQEQIQFVLDRSKKLNEIQEAIESKQIPKRVTHNDTRYSNVLIDSDSKKAICLIDLDTVMPGLAVNDFGDAIRFGASTGAEDEKDLSKVECSMELFDLFTKGFIEGCNGKLTKREMELLPMGAKVMTFECGMRFLTDYLQGDTYFKIHREEHNLDRCRTQFKLVSDMEKKWGQMHEIVKKYM